MSVIVSFCVVGEPRGKARAITVKGHSFTPQKTVNYEALVKMSFESAQPYWVPWPAHTAIRAEIKAYFMPSKGLIDSVMKARMRELGLKKSDLQTEAICEGLIAFCDDVLESTPKISRCDIDNIEKSIFDALNQICYSDDSNIFDSHTTKTYSRKPRVEITLEAFI